MDKSDSETTLLLTVVGLSYLLTVPIATYYADKHNFIPVSVGGFTLATCLLLLGTLTKSRHFRENFKCYATLLLIAGGAAMACITPTFSLLHYESSRDNRTPSGTLISGVINAQFALGGTVGPVVFGGVLYELLHFHVSVSCLGVYVFLATLLATRHMYVTGLLTASCHCPRHRTGPTEKSCLVTTSTN